MPFNGARAQEESARYLGVGQALADQAGDLCLLGGEFAAGVGGTFADGLAGGPQLSGGTLRECFGTRCGEHFVGGAQLFACVRLATLAAQPFAIEQVGPGELTADAGTAEPLDRLPVSTLGRLPVGQQRA